VPGAGAWGKRRQSQGVVTGITGSEWGYGKPFANDCNLLQPFAD